jgi:hypothetical protein
VTTGLANDIVGAHIEQVAALANVDIKPHDEALAEGVDSRVCHLQNSVSGVVRGGTLAQLVVSSLSGKCIRKMDFWLGVTRGNPLEQCTLFQ